MEPARVAAIQQLSELLRGGGGFSYLRISDGEWNFLARREPRVTGLSVEMYDRFVAACDDCTYLDLCLSNPDNQGLSVPLRLQNPVVNDRPETGWLIGDWTRAEFYPFARERRCLFVGSEATLMQALLGRPEYRELAREHWPLEGDFHFVQPPDNGNNLSRHFEALKAEIKTAIESHAIQAMFVCLGGPAKILCSELAAECGVAAVDWGSQLRGLTCSASRIDNWGHPYPPVHVRAEFTPFFFRVPFALYMSCLAESHPELCPATLAAKARCQLQLELRSMWRGANSTQWTLDPRIPEHLRTPGLGFVRDPDEEDRRRYLQSYADYARAYRWPALRELGRNLRDLLRFEVFHFLNARWPRRR